MKNANYLLEVKKVNKLMDSLHFSQSLMESCYSPERNKPFYWSVESEAIHSEAREEKDCLKIAHFSVFKRFAVFQASRQKIPVSVRITDRKLWVLTTFTQPFKLKQLSNTLL